MPFRQKFLDGLSKLDPKILLLLIFLLFFFFSASFYGSGYASLPFEDAQSTTDLSFRFRTSRAESLLVLVAGRTDYCLVMLQAGAVKVRTSFAVILYDLQYDLLCC